MGANVSKPDAHGVGISQQAGLRQQGLRRPPGPSIGYQRLPPVESRETVRFQVANVQAWRLVDSTDSLYESTTVRKSFGSAQIVPRPVAKRAPSPARASVNKKRRLVPTPRALQIAEEVSSATETDDEQKVNMGEQPALEASTSTQTDARFARPQPNNLSFFQDDEDSSCLFFDEGYASYVVSPPSNGSDLTEDQKEEQMVKTLATLQRSNIVLAKPLATIEESISSAQVSDDENDDLQEAREWMLRDQQEAAERSKKLRERNLARRQYEDHSGSSVTANTDKRQEEQQQEQQLAPPALNGNVGVHEKLSDVYSEGEQHGSNMEKLLDIAKQHVFQNSQSSRVKERDTLKSDPNAINPASQIAAEQYRTQSRHVNTQPQQEQPLHNPHGVPQENREARLRELTNTDHGVKRGMYNSVRSPRLDNQFTGDDLRSREPTGIQTTPTTMPDTTCRVNLAPKPRVPQTVNQSGVNEHPSGNRASGLEMLSAKRRENTEPDKDKTMTISCPRPNPHAPTPSVPPINRLSELDMPLAQQKVDVEPDKDNETTTAAPQPCLNATTISSAPARRISGLEMLSAKQRDNVESRDDMKTAVTSPQPSSSETPISSVAGRHAPGLTTLSAKQRLQIAAENNKVRTVRSAQRSSSATTAPSTQKSGLTLPIKFDTYDEEEKKAIVEHEIAKERKRDLEMIERVTLAIAQLRCLGEFSDLDHKELDEVQKYLSVVIEQGMCGKMKRPRIQHIRDNMRRRAVGYEEPSEADVAAWTNRVFKKSDLDFVKEELVKVEERINELGSLRTSYSTKRHNSRTKKDKRRNRADKQTRSVVGDQYADDTSTSIRQVRHSQRSVNPTQNRRQAQHAHQDRLQDMLEAKLQLFDDAAAPRQAEDSQVIDLPGGHDAPRCSQPQQRYHSDSESEEDDGAQYVFGAGMAAPKMATASTSGFTAPSSFPVSTQEVQIDQDMEEINRLEDSRQLESRTHALQRSEQRQPPPEPTTPSASTQRFDPELLKRMQNKHAQASQKPASAPGLEQSSNTGTVGVEDMADHEASATDSSEVSSSGDEADDDSEDDETSRQVFKYTVMGAFAGIEIYKDADTYIFKTTYKPASAKAMVAKIIESVLRQFPPAGGIDAGHWSLDVAYRDGLIEQHLMVGEDVTVEARVWIEKELVELDKKAYRSAKARTIAQHKFLYAVYWEKTITPVGAVGDGSEHDNHDEQQRSGVPSLPLPGLGNHHQHQQDETDIDLFGEDPPSPRSSSPMRDVVVSDSHDHSRSQARPTTTISTISPHEVQHFTTPVLANRHAKDIYMAWHATFLPGFRNEGYRRLEEDAVEQILKMLGSWGLWSREESFERVVTKEDNLAGQGGGGCGGQGRNGNGNGAAHSTNAHIKVEEKFKVWVRRIEVYGPGN
ncbi:hypothetical protein A1O1_03855 [Capronia coronata CBS 617.96]|uniref:Uncharacterized protein n=1 Tax=Capronia coronata CBS 617.96 TaxID=1182541 RepID=W9YND4_9EURO|nr:uncharacterized protein A1O1_03855 [Capronia coronata CBS 617.96]EXJ90751.1 hypothetical protein A1O1_03855 [Capronia coronata CBS 617.96]